MGLRILPAGAISAGVHHTFDETSLAAVTTTMSRMPEAAATEFDFELGFAHTGNRLTRVDLTMWLTMAMPVWSAVDGRPQPERDEWNRFLLALRAHEDGHVAICRREGPTTYERLLRATAETINDVLAAEKARILRVNAAYDHRTRHGRTQQTAHGTTVIQLPAVTP